jgi:hypothetical protein
LRFGVFLDGFFFITVVSTQGEGKSDFILRRVVNCRFGREKHPWHDEEDEEDEEEDGEEQEDDDDDEAAAEHERCGAALLQGLRPSQEDRILCVPDIPLPTFGKSFLFLVQEGLFFTQNLKFEALLSLSLSLSLSSLSFSLLFCIWGGSSSGSQEKVLILLEEFYC